MSYPLICSRSILDLRRYPFRLRHIGQGGANWFRAGLKVSGLASASTAAGSALGAVEVHAMTSLMPAMEVQAEIGM